MKKVWLLTDPDLPPELHVVRSIFLDPEPVNPAAPGRPGYEHARRTAEELKQKGKNKRTEQMPLTLY